MEYKYIILSDANHNVRVKVNALKGKPPIDTLSQRSSEYSPTTSSDSELFVTCNICYNGQPIGLPASTTFRCFPDSSQIAWNENLSFAVKYRDLPPKSQLVFTVWEVIVTPPDENGSAPPSSVPQGRSGLYPGSRVVPVGGTSMPLFNKKGVLKLGSRKLYLWKGKEGDPRDPTSTPYKAWKAQGMEKLDQIIRRFDQKELPQIQWLDNLSLRRVEKLQLKAAEDESAANRLLGPLFGSAAAMTTPTYGASSPRSMTGLKGDTSALSLPNAAASVDPFALGVGGVSHMPDREADAMFLTVEFPNFPHPVVYHQNPCNPALTPIQEPCPDRIFVLHDPEIESENPIEQKYLKLARSSKGLADRDLKPKVNERKEIARIISNPNKHLNGAEKQLLWTYRFSLIDDKRALTKFLRAVDWRDIDETKQALELMSQWSPIDIADALELLSGYFANQEVRRYAVAQLERAEDDDLLNYLLQLVQALRYEKVYPSYLSTFLINRSSKSLELANFFYWYATVEKADPKYLQILEDFMDNLERTTKQEDGTTWATVLRDQQKLISQLISLGDQSKLNRRRVDQKVERMHQLLNGDMKHLANLSKIVKMPVRTEIGVTGVVDNECTMFKSALAPMLVCFNTATPSTPTPQGPTEKDDGLQALAASSKYKVIFKIGDDLRQDQLVIQMINLMDSLLKKVNLDLKLTPYRVLATSVEHGFVEFVPKSHTLTSILQDYNRDIKQFFQTHHPKLPELAKVLDTFVKSCAGYCVITYILGVGDRHLENLMLTENGHFFHIDFSFIFGRDPKPFPPPMKFCKEMVLAMGGADSNLYADFRRYCCLAFNILRRNASLILNLLGLMSDANIPNVCNELEKNMLKVQEKFRLDLEDEEAEAFLLSLIDESVSALFPQIVEKIHKWAMYWK